MKALCDNAEKGKVEVGKYGTLEECVGQVDLAFSEDLKLGNEKKRLERMLYES